MDAGRARTSWLVVATDGHNTVVLGTNCKSRPPRSGGQIMPPPGKGTPLKEEELRTIIPVDRLGCTYDER